MTLSRRSASTTRGGNLGTYDSNRNFAFGNAGDYNSPYGYKGQYGYYTDNETGLILCTSRYYDPRVGRWLNRDPISYDGGMNLYAYCGNDPVNGVDPEGTSGWDDFQYLWHHFILTWHWDSDFKERGKPVDLRSERQKIQEAQCNSSNPAGIPNQSDQDILGSSNMNVIRSITNGYYTYFGFLASGGACIPKFFSVRVGTVESGGDNLIQWTNRGFKHSLPSCTSWTSAVIKATAQGKNIAKFIPQINIEVIERLT